MIDLKRPRQLMARRLAETYPEADEAILEAMAEIPRHAFVERGLWHRAYSDCSLPIGNGQTLSQPSTILRTLSMLALDQGSTLLEIGSGSGYLAAVASRLCRRVYGIERQLSLVTSSRRALESLGIHNVQIRYGDGSTGWAGGAPYNAILLSAAAPRLPSSLLGQLAPGGRLAGPVGDRDSQMFKVWALENGKPVPLPGGFECSFVPLLGKEGWLG